MRRLLTRLSRHLQGFSPQQVLARLRDAFEFTPGTIYDIGAYHGNWTRLARRIYPTAQYFLFEANPDHASILQSTGERHFIAALAEQDGVRADFYTPRRAGTTGASFFVEQTIHYQGEDLRVMPLTTRRLDALVKEYGLPSPDLIKLDVQGSEIAVLRGAGDLLKTCSALVAELSFIQGNKGAPLASEVITGIHELGFEPVDICKIRRGGTGNPVQVDILFANRAPLPKILEGGGTHLVRHSSPELAAAGCGTLLPRAGLTSAGLTVDFLYRVNEVTAIANAGGLQALSHRHSNQTGNGS